MWSADHRLLFAAGDVRPILPWKWWKRRKLLMGLPACCLLWLILNHYLYFLQLAEPWMAEVTNLCLTKIWIIPQNKPTLTITVHQFVLEWTHWYCCVPSVWMMPRTLLHVTRQGQDIFTLMQWPFRGQLLSVTCKEQKTIVPGLFYNLVSANEVYRWWHKSDWLNFNSGISSSRKVKDESTCSQCPLCR